MDVVSLVVKWSSIALPSCVFNLFLSFITPFIIPFIIIIFYLFIFF